MCIKLGAIIFSSGCANLYSYTWRKKERVPRVDMRSCVADRRVHAVNQKSLRRAGKLSAAHFFLLHPSFHACTESFCFQYARLSYLLVYCCEERKINWKDSCLKRSTQREKLNETLDGSTQKFDKKCERILWSKRVVFCRLWEIAKNIYNFENKIDFNVVFPRAESQNSRLFGNVSQSYHMRSIFFD